MQCFCRGEGGLRAYALLKLLGGASSLALVTRLCIGFVLNWIVIQLVKSEKQSVVLQSRLEVLVIGPECRIAYIRSLLPSLDFGSDVVDQFDARIEVQFWV